MSPPLSESVPALRISVLRWQGAPLPAGQPVPAFEFDPRGGSLGRDAACELHLPDPQRHVSRLHARIEFEGRGYVLVDLGSNPTRVDGRVLGRGQRLPLTGGEQLVIGDYELEVVALPREAQSAQPLPSSPLPRLSSPGRCQAATAGTAGIDDPFAVFAAAASPAQPAPVPLPDPFKPLSSSPSSSPSAAGSASLLSGDPAATDPLGLALESASIDDLFGLRQGPGDSSAGLVLSWESEPLAPAASVAPARPAAPQSQSPLSQAAAVSVPPQQVPPADRAAAELLAALQRGLGQPLGQAAGLTPALMELVGQLLREATRSQREAQHPSPGAGASQ